MAPPSEIKSREFCDAARQGNLPLVQSLSDDPEVDLNWRNKEGRSPFFWACSQGHVDIVLYLLGFRDNQRDPVNCNLPDKNGSTPFSYACAKGQEKVVETLLKDERIELHRVNVDEQNALWYASFYGHVNVVKRLLASIKQIDVSRKDTWKRKTAAEVAKWRGAEGSNKEGFQQSKKGCQEIAPLLESYQKDPEGVRAQLRRNLGLPEDQKRVAVEYNGETHILRVSMSSLEDLTTSLREQLAIATTTGISLTYYAPEFKKYAVLRNLADLPTEGIVIKVTVTQAKSWWSWSPDAAWIEKGYEENRYSSVLVKDGSQIHHLEAMEKFRLAAEHLGFPASQVHKIFAISNTNLLTAFEVYRDSLQGKHRASPNLFKKEDWKDLPNSGRRQLQLSILSERIGKWDWNDRTKPAVHLMIQGTSEEAVWQICQVGFGTVASRDTGFYGKGVYFTSNLNYAEYYANQGGNDLGKPFLLSAVIPGNAFPVIEDPRDPKGFSGKACSSGYQSHHVLVNEESPNMGLPTDDLAKTKFVDELVTFEAAQALPLFVFYV